MDKLDSDKVNIIQEYKKIYDECTIQEKIKVLGNIQKYQVEMIRINTMLELEKARNSSIIDTTIDDNGEVIAKPSNKKIEIEFTNYKRVENKDKE